VACERQSNHLWQRSPFLERPVSNQHWQFADLSALGDDFPPDLLLARMRQSWSFSPGAHITLQNKKKLARHGR
jgi:hypothetical protein